VYAFESRTELQNTPALTLPLFDVLLAAHSSGLSATRPPPPFPSAGRGGSSGSTSTNSDTNTSSNTSSSGNNNNSNSNTNTSDSDSSSTINTNRSNNSSNTNNSLTPPVPSSAQRVAWWSAAFFRCQAPLSGSKEQQQRQRREWRVCCGVQWKVFSVVVLCHKTVADIQTFFLARPGLSLDLTALLEQAVVTADSSTNNNSNNSTNNSNNSNNNSEEEEEEEAEASAETSLLAVKALLHLVIRSEALHRHLQRHLKYMDECPDKLHLLAPFDVQLQPFLGLDCLQEVGLR
jgi:hypothetical protein